MKKGLSLAYSIHKKNTAKGYPTPKDQNYAKGGEVEDAVVVCNPSNIANAIRAKRMASGGLVEQNSDFLSPAEEDDSDMLPSESDEFSPVDDPLTKRKKLLSKAFENVRNRK